MQLNHLLQRTLENHTEVMDTIGIAIDIIHSWLLEVRKSADTHDRYWGIQKIYSYLQYMVWNFFVYIKK